MEYFPVLGLAGALFGIGFLTCYAILKTKGRIKGAYDDEVQEKKLKKMQETWMSLRTVLAKCHAGESQKYLLKLTKEMDEHLNTMENL